MNQHSDKKSKNWDWETIPELCEEHVQANGKFTSYSEIARFLGIPRTTFFDAVKRGDFDPEPFVFSKDTKQRELDEKAVKTKIRGNTAEIRYKLGEPLSPEELFELARLDPDEWTIQDQKINIWQMGRKGREVDIEYVEGKATGFIKDGGKLHKEYLYQVTIKLTRKNRVAVKAVLNPIQIVSSYRNLPRVEQEEVDGEQEILFIADPHFGFKRTFTNKLEPFHDRLFLGGLLKVAEVHNPDHIVWNGDVLDLPDLSKFLADPAILENVQYSGIESAWLFSAMRNHTTNQYYIEGNHEERLQRAMKSNFKSAFNLKPVHQLDGENLVSVPRFLGLKELGVKWFGDYPNNFARIGNVLFSHGENVRKGSGKTISYLLNEATVSRFFGHIHRFEIASKVIVDQQKEIFVGSPGCSCIKGRVPGSGIHSNWQIGAFYITLDEYGEVKAVELISKCNQTGGAILRGWTFVGNYFVNFLQDLPDSISGIFAFSDQT